ncbi:MAG TPA: hypothetical protein VOA64_16630 [Candidatus Dormibacteraeota bacterium]|nr:hypothetical protein [Candidatus Dormibacteraeota bacterium]
MKGTSLEFEQLVHSTVSLDSQLISARPSSSNWRNASAWLKWIAQNLLIDAGIDDAEAQSVLLPD